MARQKDSTARRTHYPIRLQDGRPFSPDADVTTLTAAVAQLKAQVSAQAASLSAQIQALAGATAAPSSIATNLEIRTITIDLPRRRSGTLIVDPGGFTPDQVGRPVVIVHGPGPRLSDAEAGITQFVGEIVSASRMRIAWAGASLPPRRVTLLYLVGAVPAAVTPSAPPAPAPGEPPAAPEPEVLQEADPPAPGATVPNFTHDRGGGGWDPYLSRFGYIGGGSGWMDYGGAGDALIVIVATTGPGRIAGVYQGFAAVDGKPLIKAWEVWDPVALLGVSAWYTLTPDPNCTYSPHKAIISVKCYGTIGFEYRAAWLRVSGWSGSFGSVIGGTGTLSSFGGSLATQTGNLVLSVYSQGLPYIVSGARATPTDACTPPPQYGDDARILWNDVPYLDAKIWDVPFDPLTLTYDQNDGGGYWEGVFANGGSIQRASGASTPISWHFDDNQAHPVAWLALVI